MKRNICFGLICIGCFIIGFIGFNFAYNLGEQSGYDWGYDVAKIEFTKEVQIKCFQRVLRHEQIFDIETNILMHGSFYNTTWHETECGKYDDYVFAKSQKSEEKKNDWRS